MSASPEPDVDVIVCMPVRLVMAGCAAGPVPLSDRRQCGECLQDVWLSPTTARRARPSAKIVCLDCVHVPPDATILPWNPEQLAEAASYLRGERYGIAAPATAADAEGVAP